MALALGTRLGPYELTVLLGAGRSHREGPRPLDEALRIAKQIAEALEEVHF